MERGLANDDGGTSSDLFDFRYTQSLFFISMIARDGVSGTELENALFEETAALADGISEEELERARAVLERDHFQSISTPTGLANALSSYTQLFDDPELVYTWPMRWASITRDEVVEYAKQFLTPENRVLASLRGRPKRDSQRLSESCSLPTFRASTTDKRIRRVLLTSLQPRPALGEPAPYVFPKPTRVKVGSGTVIALDLPGQPYAAVRLVHPAGANIESFEYRGASRAGQRGA